MTDLTVSRLPEQKPLQNLSEIGNLNLKVMSIGFSQLTYHISTTFPSLKYGLPPSDKLPCMYLPRSPPSEGSDYHVLLIAKVLHQTFDQNVYFSYRCTWKR